MNSMLEFVIGLLIPLIAEICFVYLIVAGVKWLLSIFNNEEE
jgi:hypothetical protein